MNNLGFSCGKLICAHGKVTCTCALYMFKQCMFPYVFLKNHLKNKLTL